MCMILTILLIFLSYACDKVYIDFFLYFMLSAYRRGWHIIYPMILPLPRVCQKTRCVGHRTTHTNRRWGGLSMQGGFGRLGRTSLLYVSRVSHIGLAHKGDHLRTHPGIGLNMIGGWRQWRRCCRLRTKGMISWSSVFSNSRLSIVTWEYHTCPQLLSSLHLQTEVVRHLLVVLLQVWLILCKLHIFNCFDYLFKFSYNYYIF
jgi:hypothetical protein